MCDDVPVISQAKALALVRLARRGPWRPGEALVGTPGETRRLLEQLERRGLVVRTGNTRRITPAGLALVAREVAETNTAGARADLRRRYQRSS